MFAEKIGESCSTTGTGTFSLTQTAYNAFRTWRAGFASGEAAWYLATNDAGTIWEIGYGTFTTGSPDTLTRNLIASSSGSLISWVTTPYRVYSVPTATALEHMLAPLVNGSANVGGWLPAAAMWLDYALGIATAWVKKRYISGTRSSAGSHAEEGRFHIGLDSGATHIFAASQRTKFEDKGAASYVFTADDVGKVLAFNCTAAARTLTMLANNAAGMGHGAYVFIYPYGSTTNGVTFTPGGSDTTDLSTAPPGRVTKFAWDGARSKWVADYVAPLPTTFPAGTIAGLTYQNNASDATNDIDVAAGGCMSDDGTTWITIAATTKQLDVAAAADNGATPTGMLGPAAAIGDNDYLLYAINNPTTGDSRVFAEKTGTTPTLPSGFTKKRAFGWIKRSSGAIVAFKTYEREGGGLEFKWTAPTLDISLGNTLTTTRRTDAVKVPLTFSVMAILRVFMSDASTGFSAIVCCPDETDGEPSTTAAPGVNFVSGTTTGGPNLELFVRTSATGTVAARSNLATTDVYRIWTVGFIWGRRL